MVIDSRAARVEREHERAHGCHDERMPRLEGLRGRLLEELALRCRLTGRYTRTGEATAASCYVLLRTLAYIDDRQVEFGGVEVERREADFGSVGVSSMERWFTDGEVSTLNGRPEVMAWYAELAGRFGWLDVPRLSSTN